MGTETEITFRKMTGADVEKLAALDEQCFDCDAWDADYWLYETENKIAAYLVGEVGAEIVACAGAHIYGEESQAMTLAVLPEFRGCGIGQKIFAELINFCKSRGAKFMILEVRTSNLPAINLYKKFDFDCVGVAENYYLDGESAFVMEAEI